MINIHSVIAMNDARRTLSWNRHLHRQAIEGFGPVGIELIRDVVKYSAFKLKRLTDNVAWQVWPDTGKPTGNRKIYYYGGEAHEA